MIVELSGASGAGKTTLSNQLLDTLGEKSFCATTPCDYFINKTILDYCESDFTKNLLLTIATAPWALLAIFKYKSFTRFALKHISQENLPLTRKALLCRSVFRNLGIHYFFNREKFKQTIVLVDEGTIHTSHYIFLNGQRYPSHNDSSNFYKLVPKPDLLISIDSDPAILESRVLKREDKPIRNPQTEALKAFVLKAKRLSSSIYELASKDRRSVKTLLILNCEGDEASRIIPFLSSVIESPTKRSP